MAVELEIQPSLTRIFRTSLIDLTLESGSGQSSHYNPGIADETGDAPVSQL